VSHENSSVRPRISLYNGHVQIVCAEPQDGSVSVSHRRRPITQFKYDRSAGNTVKCQRPQCDLTFCVKGVAPAKIHREWLEVHRACVISRRQLWILCSVYNGSARVYGNQPPRYVQFGWRIKLTYRPRTRDLAGWCARHCPQPAWITEKCVHTRCKGPLRQSQTWQHV
jgi:hypothetical protein